MFAVGHIAIVCTNKRARDFSKYPVRDPAAAWEDIRKQAATRDLDDVRDAILTYAKNVPDATYGSIALGLQEFGIYVVAIVSLKPKIIAIPLQNVLTSENHIGEGASQDCRTCRSSGRDGPEVPGPATL
jgi:hypothetical protein